MCSLALPGTKIGSPGLVPVDVRKLGEAVGVQRIELFDPHDSGVRDIVFRPVVGEVVVNLARAQDDALRLPWRRARRLRQGGERSGSSRISWNEPPTKSSMRETAAGWRRRRFRRHDDQQLAEVALHLAPHEVEELRRARGVDHLDVVLRARLQEALKARRGMLGSLAFVAMGKEENDAARALPFRLTADDELIDDDLGAIREVAELRLPQSRASSGSRPSSPQSKLGDSRLGRGSEFCRRRSAPAGGRDAAAACISGRSRRRSGPRGGG